MEGIPLETLKTIFNKSPELAGMDMNSIMEKAISQRKLQSPNTHTISKHVPKAIKGDILFEHMFVSPCKYKLIIKHDSDSDIIVSISKGSEIENVTVTDGMYKKISDKLTEEDTVLTITLANAFNKPLDVWTAIEVLSP